MSSSTHASSHDLDILFKIDGKVEDALSHLGRLESSFERVHERLENIEDEMDQVTRHRLPSKRSSKNDALQDLRPAQEKSDNSVYLLPTMALLRTLHFSMRALPTCNATWSDDERPLSLRCFDDMKKVRKEMRNELGSDVSHDDSSSDTELPIVFPSATIQCAGASSSHSLTADLNVHADNDSA